jgi:hypothetical protein
MTPAADPNIPSLFNKRSIPTVLGVLALAWLSAAMIGGTFAYVAVGVLTVAGAIALLWLWRRTRKQVALMALIKQAQHDPQAREAALAELSGQSGQDGLVLAKLMQAQQQATTDPDGAEQTLAALDLSAVPGEVADQVRAQRVQLLLFRNRIREARTIADRIVLSGAGPLAGRAMMRAAVGEALARTGKAPEAWELLAELPFAAPELAEARPLLLYARAFAAIGTGRRDRARADLVALGKLDPTYLGRFIVPGAPVHPELRKMATELARSAPGAKRMARQAAPRGRQR